MTKEIHTGFCHKALLTNFAPNLKRNAFALTHPNIIIIQHPLPEGKFAPFLTSTK
jgi:hypothetical protein